jgi:hypothetical protein
MRPLSDTGLSANTRYAISKNVHGKALASSQFIRLFVKFHNKCHKVLNSKIKIETEVNGKSDRLWFTIWDEKIKSRYNGEQIRVRMAKEDTSVIYLFDPPTDTYLGFVYQDYEPAGDLANHTEEDKTYMYTHAAKKEQLSKNRTQLLDGILQDDESETKELKLNESLKAPMLLSERGEEIKVVDVEDETSVDESNKTNEPVNENRQGVADLEVVGVEDIPDECSEPIELQEIEI